MNDERLSFLVNRHLDVQLTADERTELEEILRGSATARAQFWHEAKLHALVHEVEHGGVGDLVNSTRSAFPRRFGIAAVLALAACLVLFAFRGLWSASALATPPQIEQTTTAIAVLSQAVDVQWRAQADAHVLGAALTPGWLHLRSGLAQVEFHNGVRLVLEGPIDVQLLSARAVVLSAGRLRTDVPSLARGFSVTTPTLTIVDLGTEFGVHVDGAHEEVHVFTGRVSVQAKTGPVRELHEGQALTVTGGGEPQIISSTPSSFRSAADFSGKAAGAHDQDQQVWRQALAQIDADPALLVHVDFEPDAIADRTMRNRSARADETGDATIVGGTAAEGRRTGKHALEFRTLSDRVRLRVPGAYRALTMVAWVRVDRINHPFNSLFMADAFAVGAVHWQIRGDGSLHLGIAAPIGAAPEQFNFDSPGIFTADRLGRWTQVALVYDSATWLLTQYVDGKPIGRFPLTGDVALRIDHGELGNWNPGTSADTAPIRNLTGRMDEFALFTRALTDAEVTELFRSGSSGIIDQQK